MPYSESTYLYQTLFIYVYAGSSTCYVPIDIPSAIHSKAFIQPLILRWLCLYVIMWIFNTSPQIPITHGTFISDIWNTHLFGIIMRCLCYVTFNYQICPMCYKQSICMHFTVKYLIFLIICVWFQRVDMDACVLHFFFV